MTALWIGIAVVAIGWMWTAYQLHVCREDAADRDEALEQVQLLRDEIQDREKDLNRLADRHAKASDRLHELLTFFGYEPAGVPEWLPEDAEAFKKFLETEHGKKFSLYLKGVEQSQNRYSIRNFPHEPAMVGCARGYGLCLAHVVSLSVVVRPETDKTNDAHSLLGEEELREKLTP